MSTQRENEILVNKFTEDSAAKFREQVLDFTGKHGPQAPVIIYIDSYGGMVDSLSKMIDTLDEIENPVVTVCMGKAMSCGAMLLSHGDVRIVTPNSRVMIHEVSAGAGGDVNDIVNDAKEIQRLNRRFMGLLAKNCGLKGFQELRKIIKNHDGRELWMDAEESVRFGIADKVGFPRKKVTIQEELIIFTPGEDPAPPSRKRAKRAKTPIKISRKKVKKK